MSGLGVTDQVPLCGFWRDGYARPCRLGLDEAVEHSKGPRLSAAVGHDLGMTLVPSGGPCWIRNAGAR